MKRLKIIIKQLFCEHEWIEKGIDAQCETVYKCEKCGKIKCISVYELHRTV